MAMSYEEPVREVATMQAQCSGVAIKSVAMKSGAAKRHSAPTVAAVASPAPPAIAADRRSLQC